MRISNETQIKQVIQSKDTSLYEIVEKVIGFPYINDSLKSNPDLKAELIRRTKITAERFLNGDKDYRYILNRALGLIYEMHIHTPDKKPVFNQFDPTLIEIQKELENAWERYEESRFPTMDIPSDPKEFERWLRNVVLQHAVADHPLFTYLEKEAVFEEMADFFSQEITVDTRFDDLVALAQVGTDGGMKMELAENYWDEMGNGEMGNVHTVMFNDLLDELGLTSEESLSSLFENVTWESLACGNALLYSVLHRKNLYKALGSLGALEMMAPKRFSRLVAGYKRLGLSEKAQKYHSLHIIIDTRHGNGWFKNAILPIVRENPSAMIEIAKGAFYRINTSMDYCNMLLRKYNPSVASVGA
jgi:pyrroloquinoline quinone (PQQ) biosynthesis protein C